MLKLPGFSFPGVIGRVWVRLSSRLFSLGLFLACSFRLGPETHDSPCMWLQKLSVLRSLERKASATGTILGVGEVVLTQLLPLQ